QVQSQPSKRENNVTEYVDMSSFVPALRVYRDTQAEQVVRVLIEQADLYPDGVPFTRLVVRLWEQDHHTWGLQGYVHQFPCSNRVIACICAKSGPIHRGWAMRAGQNTYAVTDEGRRFFKALTESVVS